VVLWLSVGKFVMFAALSAGELENAGAFGVLPLPCDIRAASVADVLPARKEVEFGPD
jgi:hypothetical protein